MSEAGSGMGLEVGSEEAVRPRYDHGATTVSEAGWRWVKRLNTSCIAKLKTELRWREA